MSPVQSSNNGHKQDHICGYGFPHPTLGSPSSIVDDEQYEPSSQPTPFSPISGSGGDVLDDADMSAVNETDGNGWPEDIFDVHNSLHAGYGDVPMCIKRTVGGSSSSSSSSFPISSKENTGPSRNDSVSIAIPENFFTL